MKKFLFSLLFINTVLLAQDPWESFKKETVLEMAAIPGWCSEEKALLMMDIIKENKCQHCIEIGVFSGRSLFPIAKALQYNRSGLVYAIDAWDADEATKGFRTTDPNFVWWNSLDFKHFYDQTLTLISNSNLRKYCSIIKNPSQNALLLFSDATIDFIHFDGNHNESFAYEDVAHYFPKVRDGGYILLNDPNWYCMTRALVFLLERAEIISPYSPSAPYFLFRKEKNRLENANKLLCD
jgi:hypothetical protein